jgi:hypothetical protein
MKKENLKDKKVMIWLAKVERKQAEKRNKIATL